MEHTSWNLMLRIFIYWLLLFLYCRLIAAGFGIIDPCADTSGSDDRIGILLFIICPFVFTVAFRFLFIPDKEFRIHYFARSFLFVVLVTPVSFFLGGLMAGDIELLINKVVAYAYLWDYFFYRPCDGFPATSRPWLVYFCLSFVNPLFLTGAVLNKEVRNFFRIEYKNKNESPSI